MGRTALRLALLALLAVPASGCFIYFGGDDGDDDCLTEPWPADNYLRDPQSGQCVLVGGGGGGGGGCVYPLDQPAGGGGGNADGFAAPEAPVYQPDWAVCENYCNALTEGECLAADACRAVYVDVCAGTMQDCAIQVFAACWAVPPSGPIRGGDCAGLDAQTCSMHDDCSAVHYAQYCPPDSLCAPTPAEFLACQDEPAAQGCYSDSECPSGYTCTEDTECLPPPGCDPATGQACPAVCYGRCVPVGLTCASVDCAPGYHCVESCDAAGQCEVACVPDAPLPMPVCAEQDEFGCIDLTDGCLSRPDGSESCWLDFACEPIYQGGDCSCTPAGCTCNDKSFLECRDAPMGA